MYIGHAHKLTVFCRLYYQHNPDRISACPMTNHALLHIADSIELIGPVWASWAFPMERFCGQLQPAIKSRRYPYASIDKYVLQHAQLGLIRLIYGLKEALTLKPRPQDQNLYPRFLDKNCQFLTIAHQKLIHSLIQILPAPSCHPADMSHWIMLF